MFEVTIALGYEVAKLYGIISKFASFFGRIQAHVNRTDIFIRLPRYFIDHSYDEVIRPIDDLRDDC
jgi:hypothetical protein